MNPGLQEYTRVWECIYAITSLDIQGYTRAWQTMTTLAFFSSFRNQLRIILCSNEGLEEVF